MDLIDLLDRDRFRALVNAVMNIWIYYNAGNIFDRLNNFLTT
jgi:hypothetical protein